MAYTWIVRWGAGHSSLIASKLGPNGLLIALDQDDVALANAQTVLSPYLDRVKIVKSNFRDLEQVLMDEPRALRDGKPQVDGILFDLGVSSPQLDDGERLLLSPRCGARYENGSHNGINRQNDC